MIETMDDILHPGSRAARNPAFPHAPMEWTQDAAKRVAKQEQLKLKEDHWIVIRALQEFFSRHEPGDIHLRELHDALEECFHSKGGIKYLYTVLPGGPVAQGCRLAGLDVPPNAADGSFGSVS